ncbi:MAG: hypothetical protein IIA27_15785 [Gemmatimonadetes bacterium]|nr:hypothetical protein [Gemmatimonadota bacterium]
MRDTAKIGLFAGGKPLYGYEEVDKTMAQTRPLKYNEKATVGPFTIELFDAGHILGSSSVRVAWDEGGSERAIVVGSAGPVLDEHSGGERRLSRGPVDRPR